MRIDKGDLFSTNGFVKKPVNKSLEDQASSHFEISDNPVTAISTPLISDQSLRARIQAVQAIQKELGIESQAAIEPVAFLTEHAIELTVLWLVSAFGSDAVEFLNKNIIEPLGPDHKDLFASQPAIRQKAIDKLKQADIKEPQKVIKSTEKLLRIFLVKSQEYPEDKLKDAKQIPRALVSILEGLYQIDDSKSEKKIYLNNSTEHGWSEHSPFWVGTSRVAGTISLFTNITKWGSGWTKRLQDLVGEADLTQERGWYGYNNTADLMATLLEYCHSNKFPVVDDGTKESIRRILVRNWKIPIVVSNPTIISIQGSKIPSTSRSEAYRLGIYGTILKTLKTGSTLTTEDPLFLRTSAPSDLESKAKEFRTALLAAYGSEVAMQEVDSTQYSEPVVKSIESILDLATEIPRWEWNETAKKEREVELKNEERFTEFKKWGHIVPKAGGTEKYSQTELRAFFEKLKQPQKESLPTLQAFFTKNTFSSAVELNTKMKEIVAIMNLSSEEEGVRLTQENAQKGLYFFRYLNALVEKEIVIERDSTCILKTRLDKANKNYLLAVCKQVVNDYTSFDAVDRDLEFYTNPLLTTVPAQALKLHQKLSRCFNSEGYVDIYGLKDFVLGNAVRNISPKVNPGETLTGGFLFSGPQGTGKSSFAEALANQMAIPLVVLNRDVMKIDTVNGGITVTTADKREIPLGIFFHEVKANAPCVLLMDEAEKLLVAREVDPGHVKKATSQEETLTGAFLSELQMLRDQRGASKVILILTTNHPSTENVDINKIDKHGFSGEAESELYKIISSTAVRKQRVDYKVFLFHKLCDIKQGEALARHFLESYVISGKVDRPSNYAGVGQVVKDYTPAVIGSVFNEVANSSPGKVSIQDMLNRLQRETSRVKLRENTELVERLQNKISSLVETDQIKQLGGELDYSSLAVAAKGLKPLQIKKALEELTPDILTQENIIAAFEQVRKSAS